MSDMITLTGTIATDPEVKYTQAGAPFTKFRLASTHRRYDDAQKMWVDVETNWYTVSTWRRLGEHAYRSFKKGERVLLTGRLHIRQWENSTGKGFSADIDADSIGHDLLWGSSTYEKDERSSRPSAQESVESWASATPGESAEAGESEVGLDGGAATIDRDGGWSVPGGPAPQEPVLVAAGEETPF